MNNKWSRMWGLLVPRPISFLANSLIFAGGMLLAWLEGYRGIAAGDGSGLPAWLFVLLWYVAQEVLVQQAKYMWNDCRDHERDQQIPANRIRPIARQPLKKSMTAVMIGRWVVGITLAAWVSPVLLTVVLLISGLQVIYERWAKPWAGEWPWLPLFVVGAGMVLKGGGGCLAMGWLPGDQRGWLYGLALFATGVVFVSSFWRTEGAYFAEEKLPQPRGQSVYFMAQGITWLKAGTAVTIPACALLILDGTTHFLGVTGLPIGLVLGLIFAAAIVCCLLAYWLMCARRIFRLLAATFFATGCAATLWLNVESLFPFSNETFAAALVLVVLLIDHRLNYHMDYRQQNLIYLSENWSSFKGAIRERPSQITPWQYGWHLLRLAAALNTPRYQLLWEQSSAEIRTRPYFSAADLPAQKQEAPGEGRPN